MGGLIYGVIVLSCLQWDFSVGSETNSELHQRLTSVSLLYDIPPDHKQQ